MHMDSNRTVAGLDAHKDSVYLCIMGYDKTIIFQKTYGVADSTTSLQHLIHYAKIHHFIFVF